MVPKRRAPVSPGVKYFTQEPFPFLPHLTQGSRYVVLLLEIGCEKPIEAKGSALDL